MSFKHRQGFTIIELLVVIVIIGILATMATISVSKMREKANDTKRVSDVKQIQHALDLYANDQGVYPVFGMGPGQFAPGYPLVSPDGVVTYMKKVPNHGAKTGTCAQPEYIYAQGVGGLSYTLSYCVGNPVYEIAAGTCIARPGILCSPQLACSNSDKTKPCCGTATVGSECDGGTVFATGYLIGSNTYKLIIYEKDPNLTQGYTWDTNVVYNNTTAISNVDGLENTNKLLASNFAAAACRDSNYIPQNYNDWYLPARDELSLFANSSVGNLWYGTALTSTEYSVNEFVYITATKTINHKGKGEGGFAYCIRRISN